jgi:ATP-dependent helicase HrpB
MNKALPIQDFRKEILAAIRSNPVVVITAETGAGKSTQVPQYLLAKGYDMVVTQPRRLAARTVATRVAEERGEALGGIVGYRTAVDRQDSSATRCLFCTDGLALVRELMGQNKGILVLDEVHEWNENMEVLCAWAKQHQIETGADFKVVLMSATLEAEKLAAFYNNAPVISVPGRQFPVEDRQASLRLVDDVATLVSGGRNVLVFQPGKQEIVETCSALEQMQVNAEILPLHGQLTPEEQAKCFAHYGRPKVVVSTNVAQTSVTIDDIDAVVDSGMERRIELVDGVEGLYLKPISLADATQRKGRAGRTKAGIYIDHCSASSRPDFPVAEILRKRLDQTVLRLAIAGFDMEELEFFHQPNKSDIHDARRTLVGLGCMTEDGSVTKIGKLVNRLPVSVAYARMLVEADRLGVVDDVLTVAAIMEMGGITVPPPSRNQPDRPDWRRMVPAESESDVMGQLSVWEQAENMTKDEMREKGVSLRSFFRAKEIRRHLAQAVKQYFRPGSTGRREDILKAVCAGMVDHLYKGEYGSYRNGENVERELGTASLVRGAEWLVGKPFDLQIKTRRGMMTLKLIELASKVDPMWLTEIAPQLVEQKTGLNPRYDASKDMVVSTTQVFFNKQMVREEAVADGEHPEATMVFTRWLSGRSELPSSLTETNDGRDLEVVLRTNAGRQERARQMNIRTGEETFKVYSQEEVFERFATALSGVQRIAEVARPEVLALPTLDEEQIASVLRDNPDAIEVLGSELVVEYRTPSYGTVQNPRVKLEGEMVGENRWLNLPDEGVRLPGSRLVEVMVSFGYRPTISDTDIPKLKENVREHLNREQWDGWSGKPELALPDPAVEGSEIPFATAVYGQCVVTGDELKAYGTVRYQSGYYSSGWEAVWYRDREEAEKVRAEATQKLEASRVEARQKRELETAKAEAQAAREQLRGLSSCDGWYDLDSELRRKVENRRYEYLPNSIEELCQHKADTEALVAKVEVELAETLRRREEEAKAQAEAERAEREELAVILAENGADLADAREIRWFAEGVVEILGASGALKVLQSELDAPYGRVRRQDAILSKAPGIDQASAGDRFLRFFRARDVDSWLAGAVAWLELKSYEDKSKSRMDSSGTDGEERPPDNPLDALRKKWGAK